jgi:hypothetical protein
VAVALGALWLSIAGSSPIWATITIWIMAAGAITAALQAPAMRDPWLLDGAPAILAGWLSAAAAVSTGVVVAGYGLLSDTLSAAAMLALVLAVAVSVQMRLGPRPVYGLTVIWALIGVVVVNAGANLTVAILAASGAVIMGLTLLSTRRA